ncbi:glycosyltransferase family 92 protein F13G3.3-like [Arapaima gigas]
MECPKKWKFLALTVVIFVIFKFFVLREYLRPEIATRVCVSNLSNQPILLVKDTKHLIISAYKDHRIHGAVRIISIMERLHVKVLSCIVCCSQKGYVSATAEVDMHSDNFGFPFVTTDLLCKTEPSCNATAITVVNTPYLSDISSRSFLPIRNQKKVENDFPYNFTVCISNLFGDYNNVLQFVQTIEIYKILGVQKVYIYNTSCGPDLERVLQYYKEEGILEVAPWPIDHFLNPSKGWNFQEHKGDIHYYGQLTTLNDCIYRNMYRSRYVLLNDIDEIIVPYQHATLGLLMEDLQRQNPSVSVFLIENHIFPKTVYDSDGRFSLPQWEKVPGVNILEHIYREPARNYVFNPTKMIINPREVIQTSVHSVLKNFGDVFNVPFDVCRIVHVRIPLQGSLKKEELIIDTKLWEYKKELVPNVNHVLQKSGFYT